MLAMGDSFHVWQSQKRRLVEITPQVRLGWYRNAAKRKAAQLNSTQRVYCDQGQVVSCDLLYRSPFVNDWGPITQQFNFKGSLLSSGPTYSFCKCAPPHSPLGPSAQQTNTSPY